ncbi:Phenylpropionate dioxygenase, large terminal subunit [Sphingobium faniae]|nr:Phenylpropionate dioxygenase, large terminal subunit [Sphingobium faniae]
MRVDFAARTDDLPCGLGSGPIDPAMIGAAIGTQSDQMRSGVDIPPLPEIAGGRYTSETMQALEDAWLWRRTWLCAGRESMIPKGGDYFVFRKAGASILVVRGKDGKIRAFHNACRHRGASVVREDCGHAGLLRCQFHSWAYNLEGHLVGVPEENGFPGLDRSERGLLPVRCETFEGWIFLNQNPEAEPLEDFLGEAGRQLTHAAMGDLRVVERRSYRAEANWKVTLDAFLESYHLNTIHPQTAAIMNDAQNSAIHLFERGHAWLASLRRQYLSQDMGEAGQPDISAMHESFRKYAITYNLYPNLVSPIDPVGFPILLMWPVSRTSCEIEIYFLGPDWGEGERPSFYESYFAFFDQLIEEDLSNLASMQKSLDSGFFPGALLNWTERKIYWQHQSMDEQIGRDRIPQEFQVKPVLMADGGMEG